MSAPILVVGSVALDTIETPFSEKRETLGGSALWFSAAASLLAPVRLVGVIGSDFPTSELEFWRRRGVDLSGLATAEGPSFRWHGRYELDMNRRQTVSLELGVFDGFRPEIPGSYRDSPFVFLGNIDPALQLDVLAKLSAARLRACDTIDHWIREKRKQIDEMFSKVDIVFINEDEARLYADTPNLQRAARSILERGCRAVVIKKGENGALAVAQTDTGASTFVAVAYPLEEVIDPTGAGDAFAGGVMGSLAASNGALDPTTLRRAVVAGSVLASFAVEDFGPQTMGRVTMADVEERLQAIRAMVNFETA